MSIKARLSKLESSLLDTNNIVIIALEEGETNDTAYQRCFHDGSKKPKVVIFATNLDLLL